MTAHPPDTWMADAACRDQPAGWFTEPNGAAEIRAAVATCANCPVRQPCLHAALGLAPDEDLGIWGGTTVEQRQRLRTGRQQRPQAASPTHTRGRRASWETHSAPRLTVARNAHGDFTDTSERATITRLNDRDYVLIIDGHVTARVPRLTDAQEVAWRTLRGRARPMGPSSADRTRVTRATSR